MSVQHSTGAPYVRITPPMFTRSHKIIILSLGIRNCMLQHTRESICPKYIHYDDNVMYDHKIFC